MITTFAGHNLSPTRGTKVTDLYYLVRTNYGTNRKSNKKGYTNIRYLISVPMYKKSIRGKIETHIKKYSEFIYLYAIEYNVLHVYI